ncbi:MAG: DnaD domain protein [Bacilli bacterium]|nr:DnaD domain protein [Acholeplasmataceae bacterium]MDY2901997.1 DnaD domain protein [Bacilli bacterium]
MSQYYTLLKNDIINFDQLLLDKYNVLGLDEVETIILIKLNKILKSGKKFSIDLLTSSMSISENDLRNRLVSLINNQFITLMLDGKNELYSIDDTYKRLADAIVQNDIDAKTEKQETEVEKVVNALQKSFNKILTPLDLEMVHNWIYQDKFSFDTINNAIIETLKIKKTSVHYVDAILSKKEEIQKEHNDDGLQNLFNQVYGKIK